jgi:hypothetical protein
MKTNIQFRINSYIQLAKVCDDELLKKDFISKAKNLLDDYEQKLVLTQQPIDENDDWKKGIIEEYLNDKTSVCLIQIWQEALYKNYAPRFPEMKRKNSNELVEIIVNQLGWERGNVEIFNGYGKQKSYHKKETEYPQNP